MFFAGWLREHIPRDCILKPPKLGIHIMPEGSRCTFGKEQLMIIQKLYLYKTRYRQSDGTDLNVSGCNKSAFFDQRTALIITFVEVWLPHILHNILYYMRQRSLHLIPIYRLLSDVVHGVRFASLDGF